MQFDASERSKEDDDDGSHQFCQWTSALFTEFVIILEETSNGVSCSYSKSLGDRQSVSSLCSWQHLKLCLDCRENVSARASTVESDWFANSARAAVKNLRRIPNLETIEAGVKSADVTKDKELVRLSCRKPEDRAIPSNKASKKQFWKALPTLRRSRKQNWANQRNTYVRQRRTLGHWCESAKHEQLWDVGLGKLVHRQSSKLSTDCGNQHRNSERISERWDQRAQGNVRRKVSHLKQREISSKNISQFTT